MDLTRRFLLASGTAGAATLVGARPASAAPPLLRSPSVMGAPSVSGLHLQFGADASREVVVSWLTPERVRRPEVRYGTLAHGLGRTVAAETVSYQDGITGTTVYVQHARIRGLQPGTTYAYLVTHGGAPPESGTFTTGPRGRQPFTFTSFGDQATANLRKNVDLPSDFQPNGPYPLPTSNQIGTQASADIVTAVERISPLFNLINGDLCYAGVAGMFGQDRVATWADWFISNSRSARQRPWMPCVGNHENELHNGPLGIAGYQAYFALPDSRSDEETRGMWYSFTAGSVRVISLANCDVAYQDGGDSYIRGYSGGAQRRWLERELSAARSDTGIDWVVVCMHQPFISSTEHGNGSDLGVREAWGPLFDEYGVDLVVSGHDHHYERSHPVRGTLDNETRTPIPVSTRTDVIDTSKGTVHLVIGGGGNFATSENDLFAEPKARVIVARSDEPSPTLPGHYDSIWVPEDAPWAAVKDRENQHGFAAFEVDPGGRGASTTRIKVTYYTFHGPHAELEPVDSFVLERPRADAQHRGRD